MTGAPASNHNEVLIVATYFIINLVDYIQFLFEPIEATKFTKKGDGWLASLHARQPINTDCTACGVTPELDELLDGEDTRQVLDGSAVLSMATLELVVSRWIPGEPSYVGHTDDVAVQVSLKNACAASWTAISVRVTS